MFAIVATVCDRTVQPPFLHHLFMFEMLFYRARANVCLCVCERDAALSVYTINSIYHVELLVARFIIITILCEFSASSDSISGRAPTGISLSSNRSNYSSSNITTTTKNTSTNVWSPFLRLYYMGSHFTDVHSTFHPSGVARLYSN